ncbi:unnamed protein product [Cylindrotheca closterium]|uniref:Peptidase M11 gametolysin domain-containing protein n=1 Tax=Cylindrotheca closterium TaxID=2856 RepID=A0AAD2CL09_9STRA|nr:unnamed protein product [Cylindrotheca closterium]
MSRPRQTPPGLASKLGSLAQGNPNEQNLPCTLFNVIVEFEDGTDESEWACEVSGIDAKNVGSKKKKATVMVEGMEHVLAAKPDIQSGRTTLFAKGARFNKGNLFSHAPGLAKQQLFIGSDTPLTFGETEDSEGNERRRLSATTGDLSVLVVRVSTNDRSLAKSKAEISGDVFGTGGSDSINLKSLVEGCSNNVATVNPGSGSGTGACQDNPDAIFAVPRDDGGLIYDCDFFNNYQFNTPGDLCPAYGDATQTSPTIDGSKTAKTECCVCGGGSLVSYNNNVVDGVMDLQLSINAVGSDRSFLETTAVETLKSLFYVNSLSQIFDNVMLCLPKGSHSNGDTTKTNWLAYAYIGGDLSVYNGDRWCANEVTQIHELGHNWGLQHASEGSVVYGDLTGAMGSTSGAGDDVAEGNRMCFNGAHSWQLGWYTPYNLEIDPLMTNFDGTLVGADRVPNVLAGENVVLKLANPQEDYYLMFNHAVGANDGTTEADNRVTITTKTTDSGARTYLISKLSQSTSVTFSNWAGTSQSVTVMVTSITTATGTGNAKVEVWKGEIGDRPGFAPTPQPTPNPTAGPTPNPTPGPTPPPTPGPTPGPTLQPTPNPTPGPTPLPPPTNPPTPNPTPQPTPNPTPGPTPVPPPPTPAPTPLPTPQPTPGPTNSSPGNGNGNGNGNGKGKNKK